MNNDDLPSTIQQLLSDVVNVNDESRHQELSVVPSPIIPTQPQRGSMLVICGDGIESAMDHQEGGWLCTLNQIYRNSLNIITWDTTGLSMPQIARQAKQRIYEEHGPTAQLRCVLIITGTDDTIKNTIINNYCLSLADLIDTTVNATKIVQDPRHYYFADDGKAPPVVVMSSTPMSLQPLGDVFEHQLALSSAASGIAAAQRDSGGVHSPVYFIDQLNLIWKHQNSTNLFCGGTKYVLTTNDKLQLSRRGNDVFVDNIIKLFSSYRQDLLPKLFNPTEIPFLPTESNVVDQTVKRTALMDLIDGNSSKLEIPKSVYGSFSIDHDVDTIISKVAKELNMPTSCAFKPSAKTCPDCSLPLTVENGDRLPFCSVSGEVHEVSFYDEKRIRENHSDKCSDCGVHKDTHPFCTSTGRPHHNKNFDLANTRKQELKNSTRIELLSRPIGAIPRQLTKHRTAELPSWSSQKMPISHGGLDPLKSLPALLMTPGGYTRRFTTT